MIDTSATSGPRLAAAADSAYRQSLPVASREPHLRRVLLDTLANPGGLTRLKLGLIAGQALGLPAETSRALATACEYFHTASLLLDDLPCMDDARERRGRPCAHRTHGEPAAILGALAFINRAYRLAWDSFACAPEAARADAAAHLERCLGAAGVLDGQSLDLHFADSARTPRDVARAALGKTVALLRLTLVTPALLAHADGRERRLLDRAAVYWGLAYQIADDCADLRAGPVAKTPGRDAPRGRPNFALAAGRETAISRLARLLGLLDLALARLVAIRPSWECLRPLVDDLAQSALPARDRRCA